MSRSHFEQLVEKAMNDLEKAAIRLPLGDTAAVQLAQMQGKLQGLEQAATLYRQSVRADVEGDLT